MNVSNVREALPLLSESSRLVLPAFARIDTWCGLSGMGRSSTYEALAAGHLLARKVGARTLIDVRHGIAWLNSLPAAAVRSSSAKRNSQTA